MNSLSMPQRIICWPIVVGMKPHELLLALMAAKGRDRSGRVFGASALARAVKRPQPTIYRLMTGEVVRPDFDTAAPVAAFFDVPITAMYDERVATAIAKERGLSAVASPKKRPRQKTPVDPMATKIAQLFARVAESGVSALSDNEKLLHQEVRKAYDDLIAGDPDGFTGNTRPGELVTLPPHRPTKHTKEK